LFIFKYKIRSLTYGIWLYIKTNIRKTKIVQYLAKIFNLIGMEHIITSIKGPVLALANKFIEKQEDTTSLVLC
jgi:hypothetical protein